ncbi:hypothetical protein FOBRF1_013067 [Fusarium oxysporum]
MDDRPPPSLVSYSQSRVTPSRSRWTGLMERSASVNTRSDAVETADFDWGLAFADADLLDILCVPSNKAVAEDEEACCTKEPSRVVCVNEEDLRSAGREGAILGMVGMGELDERVSIGKVLSSTRFIAIPKFTRTRRGAG